MGDLGFCTIFDIYKNTWDSLLTDIPADFGMPFLLIRFLHNKPFIYTVTALRCFFQYIDIEQITQFLPAFLLFYIGYFFIRTPKKKAVYSFLIFLILLFIFDPFKWNLGTKILLFRILYYGIAVYAGILFSIRLLRKKATG